MTNDSKNNLLHPFVKWAGGKTQLLDELHSLMPKEFNTYFEPFVGGGSFFFSIAPKKAVINDFNKELVSVYKCLELDELYDKLIEQLKIHEQNHSKEYFYRERSLDMLEDFDTLPNYIRAARMIYLNKACFNGLYRVNSKGYFNVPFGQKRSIKTFNEENMKNLHNFFKCNDITILNCDFEEAVKDAKENDFVYFDPPYDNLDDQDSFTSYTQKGFGKEEQVRLSNLFKKLDENNVYVMLSNHNTKLINELYKDFNIHIVNAKRMINSDANGRGFVEEVIITNY